MVAVSHRSWFPAVARATACLLLTLTAFDLTNPSLCALDNGGGQNRTAAAIDQGEGGAAITLTAVPATGRREAEQPLNSPIHVDDCICCSHCIDVTALVGPLAGLAWFAPVGAASDRSPDGSGQPSYHPPRL